MKKIYWFSVLCLLPLLGITAPLPANDVFQLSVQVSDPNTFIINWTIKPGYFLYNKRISVVETNDRILHLGRIPFPEPLKRTDTRGNTDLIYRNQLALPVPILGNEAGETLIDVHFQGCSDAGFCYPPQTIPIKLSINSQLALRDVSVENPTPDHPRPPKANIPIDRMDRLFSTNNWFLITISFFGFGLLLAFTPCVLPMVPVLSGIIIGHGANISTRKAFLLSLSYVLSMSITYGMVGALIAILGNNLQIAMQSPWAISLFSLLFVLLALSMFNVYELRLPLSLQSKLGNITRRQASGHYLSAAFMGCMSTLILSPCVTAPLIGALSYIARSGDLILGILALFFLGLGMGTPLLLIGTSAGKLLPKAGLWMNAVKSVFGVLFLAVAIYLMARLLPSTLTMGLWATLLVFSGIYMGALQKADTHSEKFCQGSGIICLVYGLLVLIGASQGNNNPLQPLLSMSHAEVSQNNPSTIIIKNVHEAQKILALARNEGKPALIDFYADWCASCQVMEATTLKDTRVKSALNTFIVIKADLTANNSDTRELLNYFQVVAPPTFLFFDNKGDELNTLRLMGEVSANQFMRHLKHV